tara:strand:+ start:1782 stop:1973 length:192 start_codon:yes stop_codon:yes gene_type:complete
MKLDIEYTDVKIIVGILENKSVEYRDRIVNGYTDDVTSLDKLKELEEEQKRIVYILDKLGEKL